MKRNSNAKYLGYGLVIGMAIASMAGAGLLILNETARAMILPEQAGAPLMAPGFTPTDTIKTTPFQSLSTLAATATFTPTPTYIYFFTPTASEAPVPTATLTIGEQKAKVGELYFTGPLTQEEQVSLYNTSITFIAHTTREGIRVGEEISADGYGSPTLICGPLSIAILQRSGMLTADIIPFDFWLLNPFLPKDRAILKRTFPPERYEHFEVTDSLNHFDFAAFPLLPGDFLYIKHGSGGTFDHMLVVNRVDGKGRAYSVTNYDTGQEFVIDEALLYDPLDPSAGMFKVWTKKRNSLEGATGFGGFELWRRAQ